ncbi:DUF4436 family protein [Rhodococcus sp. IEGM 1305]|uniref:DUF4436 family protein n=1 Tax=Rhodococcus sp. IEGM 1305 TaxID=3047092 RepID=UPI0024B8344E|nr:DUF4436 family protein [Rhodococcus sp. IEGM 1305]MDI9950596.1 DUF4436 family protein [Rhodococcus sp. IEGM 1305]
MTSHHPRLQWAVPALLLALIYAASLTVYGLSSRTGDDDGAFEIGSDEVVVLVTAKSLQPTTDRVQAEVTITVGEDFLHANGDTLNRDITLLLIPSTSHEEIVFRAGASATTFDTEFIATGNAAYWPFDRFEVNPMVVEAYQGLGADRELVPTALLLEGRVDGWKARAEEVAVDTDLSRNGTGAALMFARTGGNLIYAGILLLMMTILAGLAAFVALQTFRRKRAVNTDMLGWMAAMLFAVVPLRGILPGSPPIGSWVDIALTVWVVSTLVASLALFVFCWWRDSEAPAQHEVVATRAPGSE